MRVLPCALTAFLGIAIPAFAQTSAPPSKTLRVKIEADGNKKELLLGKLNEEGAKRGIKFEVTDENFDYRIEFDSTYAALGGPDSGTYASAKVHDGKGATLFSLQRNSRSPFVNQDVRVTNAVAKEIIKRLQKLPAK